MNENEKKLHYIKLFKDLIDMNKIGVAEACSAMMAIVIPTLVANNIPKEALLRTIDHIYDRLKKK